MTNPKHSACVTLASAMGILISLGGFAGCSNSQDLASEDLGIAQQALGCGGTCGLGYNCINNQCTTSSTYYNPGAVYTPPPDLGPNVKVYTTSTSVATINADLTAAYNVTGQFSASQFITNRYAFLFAPGTYSSSINIPIGYYTQVAGVADMPDAVNLAGPIHSDGDPSSSPPYSGLTNFWRSIENFENTSSTNLQWVTSQACPVRRVHTIPGVDLSHNGGYTSGGFVADSRISVGALSSGSQQQWFTRNSRVNWSGGNWNMVFEGVFFTNGSPPTDSSFPGKPYTVVSNTSTVREKPWLYIDRDGIWNVFIPAVRTNANNYSWTAPGSETGTKIALSNFYIAKPGDTDVTMNAALAQGKHLLVTPGIYTLNAPLHITNANTVVLGLGMATLAPQGGVNAINVDDVDGVKIAGFIFDAGAVSSAVLLQVGPTGSSANHSSNPTSLHDLFFRVGGAQLGQANTCLQINSNDVIGDDFWAWRADHGTGVGWTSNVAPYGVVVNGNNVTLHGLFVEHFQNYQTVWNGNGGTTVFYQSELPYDPPNQSSWMHGTVNGFASYEVNGSSHVAKGLGIYAVFTNANVNSDNAIETASGARFHHMVTLSISANGHIYNVINGTGGAANPRDFSHYPRLTDYNN